MTKHLIIATFLATAVTYSTAGGVLIPPRWTESASIQAPLGLSVGRVTYNPALQTPCTQGTCNWHIAQWNNSHPLGAFNGSNTVASASSRVTFTPASTSPASIEFALNGDYLGCNVEANLFAEPTTSSTYSTPPFATVKAATLALNGNQLYHRLNVTPKYWQQLGSPCVTQAKFITSFVLKNVDDPYLTLFYQLTLHNVPVTPSRLANLQWFFNGVGTNGKTWGFGDNSSSFSYAYPTLGQTVAFAADLKPRLRQVITDPANNIPAQHKNPDRWYVNQHYHGPHVWGGVRTTYTASGFFFGERAYTSSPLPPTGPLPLP